MSKLIKNINNNLVLSIEDMIKYLFPLDSFDIKQVTNLLKVYGKKLSSEMGYRSK